MAYKKTSKLFLGKKALQTKWGQYGKARGMYTGGYTRWVYGIKGIFTFIILERWGQFWDMEIKP